MAELKGLSKLKKAGKLHFWRGTIEIDERELHAICDEIQAEYDMAVAAMNKAAGNWAKADTELRKALDFMRIWISEDAHLGESVISCEFEKAEGLRKLDAIEDAIADELNSRVKPPCDGGYCPLCGAIERTCHIVKNSRKYVLSDGRELFDDGCSICNGYVGDGDNYCSNCGARVVGRNGE